jgi:hypothetical protein
MFLRFYVEDKINYYLILWILYVFLWITQPIERPVNEELEFFRR